MNVMYLMYFFAGCFVGSLVASFICYLLIEAHLKFIHDKINELSYRALNLKKSNLEDLVL